MIMPSNMFVKPVGKSYLTNIDAVVGHFSIKLVIIYRNQDKSISNTSMLVGNI